MENLDIQLTQAASAGDLERVRAIVESGASVNAADESGVGTLLTFHPAVTQFLLENGADPNAQTNEFGASVLAGLCYVDQIDCVRLLLEHGADPNLGRRETAETPLHHAIANDGSQELVELLIANGADVNAKTNAGFTSYNFYGETPTRGETSLHRAAAYANADTVELLLTYGADRNLADVDGYLPFHWAGWHRRSKSLVELLSPRKS